MKWAKHYYQLLFGLGISQLGNWIYLIAINVFIWKLTESPAAVAGLYMIGPCVRIICSFFVGSYIDRWDKKKIVIITDIVRGLLICLMPFVSELWVLYCLVGFTNVASTFFSPSSTYLISTLVADEHKPKFNSLQSTINSGAFMVGPALAGAILMVSTTDVAILVNGVSFFICAVALSFLPEEEKVTEKNEVAISLRTLVTDWKQTISYAKNIRTFSKFLVVYSIALMITFALDSQEMSFLFTHFNISEALYGFTVTIAGIGAIIGGIVATSLTKKFTVTIYIKYGFLLTVFSYFVFFIANVYWVAVVSYIALGFFIAFSNSGFATLYQTTVQPEMMGRFGSLLNLGQSILQVIFTSMIGILAQWYSIQWTVVGFAAITVVLAGVVCLMPLTSNNKLKRSREE